MTAYPPLYPLSYTPLLPLSEQGKHQPIAIGLLLITALLFSYSIIEIGAEIAL